MLEKTKLAFLVVETLEGWIVRADGFVYPRCSSFPDALFSAMREAQAAELLGFASAVLARRAPDRPCEIQWTYGRDASARLHGAALRTSTGFMGNQLAKAPGDQGTRLPDRGEG